MISAVGKIKPIKEKIKGFKIKITKLENEIEHFKRDKMQTTFFFLLKKGEESTSGLILEAKKIYILI